jgi:hypothetical protein
MGGTAAVEGVYPTELRIASEAVSKLATSERFVSKRTARVDRVI